MRNWPRSAFNKARTTTGGQTKDLWKWGLVPGSDGFLCPGLANRIPAQRHSLFVRPLPFSLSLSTAGKAVIEMKPIATPTIKYEIGPLLKDLMEWPTPPKSAYVIGELMAGNNPYGLF
ncbi:unnamed protein product [Withania somnifera]